jgi:toxin-antitoxin system PIN domain toxin
VQLIDANVLLHAVNERAREHDVARHWLIGVLGGSEVVGLAWPVLLAFLRLSTHPAIFPRPLEVGQAASTVEAWLGSPQAVLVEPTRRHLPLLRGLLVNSGTAGNLVGDAHLAALALEHDATVISFDRDFDRFEGVRWRLPS